MTNPEEDSWIYHLIVGITLGGIAIGAFILFSKMFGLVL